ncbi:hypothetical protein DJ55_2956 [Yersinia pseudotuberculosis]|nr:hypothetical protein DJ55_2956 [Yersinia pseudotuberculosis]
MWMGPDQHRLIEMSGTTLSCGWRQRCPLYANQFLSLFSSRSICFMPTYTVTHVGHLTELHHVAYLNIR